MGSDALEPAKSLFGNRWRMTADFIISAACLFSAFGLTHPPSCHADMNPALDDKRLVSQYDWAIFLDVQDINHFLDYKGSQLHPSSRVRVSFREFDRTRHNSFEDNPSRVYEELWYHEGNPLGMKRRMMLDVKEQSVGIVSIGPTDSHHGHIHALANALLRVLIDVQFHNCGASIVIVPKDNYDQVLSELESYGFIAQANVSSGKQMSIHLSSDPAGSDDYLFLMKK